MELKLQGWEKQFPELLLTLLQSNTDFSLNKEGPLYLPFMYLVNERKVLWKTYRKTEVHTYQTKDDGRFTNIYNWNQKQIWYDGCFSLVTGILGIADLGTKLFPIVDAI